MAKTSDGIEVVIVHVQSTGFFHYDHLLLAGAFGCLFVLLVEGTFALEMGAVRRDEHLDSIVCWSLDDHLSRLEVFDFFLLTLFFLSILILCVVLYVFVIALRNGLPLASTGSELAYLHDLLNLKE